VFPIGGLNLRLKLERMQERFLFKLEPVDKTADKIKAVEHLLGEWKLFIRNGNNEGVAFEWNKFTAIHNFLVFVSVFHYNYVFITMIKLKKNVFLHGDKNW
jgi:hypothetical protein